MQPLPPNLPLIVTRQHGHCIGILHELKIDDAHDPPRCTAWFHFDDDDRTMIEGLIESRKETARA